MAGGWASLGLLDELVEAAESDFGWLLPTAVQDECIPLILGGGDVMASAETGSGKTAAFALPALQLCHEHKGSVANGSSNRKGKQGKTPKGDCKGENGSAATKQELKYEMSSVDRSKTISIDPQSSKLIIQSRDTKAWAGCRCTSGVASCQMQSGEGGNRYYFECTIRDEGIVRIGVSTSSSSLELGTDEGGYGYGGTGMKVHSGNYEPYGTEEAKKVAFGKGDVVGCLLDLGDGKEGNVGSILFSKNGDIMGKAFHLPPQTKEKDPVHLYPAVCVKNAECQLNFGGDSSPPLSHLPEGYCPISTATIGNGGVPNPVSSSRPGEKGEGPYVIVIEPTRDLAEQTYRAFADFADRLPSPKVESALLVGGIHPSKTLSQLEKNKVDVLVGTPPIIASFMSRKKIRPGRCRVLILDEADQLVSKDTIDHVMTVYSKLGQCTTSAFDRLQVCFFSATLHSKEVRKLTKDICHRPLWVDLRGKDDSMVPETVHHCVVTVEPAVYESARKDFTKDPEGERVEVVSDAVHRRGELSAPTPWEALSVEDADSERIKRLKPHVIVSLIETFMMEQVLIFCRTNLDCDHLEKFFRTVSGNRGDFGAGDKYSCRVLAGMRSMEDRRNNLQAFKDGTVRILIATDVAARGIDIKELPFVINVTLPDQNSAETYVHRVGRVGRAERMGLAISIVAVGAKEKVWWCRGGRKPPCSDCRLFEEGGNCKWFDESSSLRSIEKLLKDNKVSMTRLSWPDINVPAEISALIKGGGYGELEGAGGNVDPEVKACLEHLSGKVSELGVTEFALQSGYWKLQDRFKPL